MQEIKLMDELLHKTIIKTEQIGDDIIKFYLSDGAVVTLQHDQDCCEWVGIVDIDGDINNLIGYVHEAEVITNDNYQPKLSEGDDDLHYDSDVLWTFYKIGTDKEFVNIRWMGTSNGYYSIEVGITVNYPTYENNENE